MSYLFLDPGASTGIATFDDNALPDKQVIVRGLDDLTDWLTKNGPFTVVVFEDFRLFSHKAKQLAGSRMDAVQAIGIIKAIARQWDVIPTAQQPQCHKLGQLYPGGSMYSGKHDDNHHRVAFNHGIYYLTKHGLTPGRKIVNAPSAEE
jgi:hypothetical protein